MKAMTATRIGAVVLLSLGLSAMAFGQGKLKNAGTFINTGTASYNSVENYKGGTGGTIANSGTLTTSTTVDNDDGATGQGTIRNYIGGTAAGKLTVGTNLLNETGTFLNDSTTYAPLLQIGGSITSTGTFDTDGGIVDYNAAGAQNVFTTTYGALVASGTGAKTLLGSVTVNDSARIHTASLAVSTQTLTMKGATFTLQNAGALSAASGTVDYNGDLDQAVVPTTYGNLTLSGSTGPNVKTASGNVTLSASGALTVGSNDTLYVTGNLDLTGAGVTLANNEAIRIDGNATFVGTIANAGSFYYSGTSTQTIGAITYSDLTLGWAGQKDFPSGTVAVTGDYVIEGSAGTRDYTTNSNTFSFAGTGTQNVSGLSETFYVLDFSGGGAKNLSGTSMGAARMDISSGSGVVTNDVSTVTLTNISTVSLTLASGTTLVNNATRTITMNGDLENDGSIFNAGTISVY